MDFEGLTRQYAPTSENLTITILVGLAYEYQKDNILKHMVADEDEVYDFTPDNPDLMYDMLAYALEYSFVTTKEIAEKFKVLPNCSTYISNNKHVVTFLYNHQSMEHYVHK